MSNEKDKPQKVASEVPLGQILTNLAQGQTALTNGMKILGAKLAALEQRFDALEKIHLPGGGDGNPTLDDNPTDSDV